MLLSSHEMDELAVCTRLLVLKGGKVREAPAGLTAKELAARF